MTLSLSPSAVTQNYAGMIPLIRDLSNYPCQPVRRVIGPSIIGITGPSPKVFAIDGMPTRACCPACNINQTRQADQTRGAHEGRCSTALWLRVNEATSGG